MATCFCTGACLRGEGCAARPAWRTQTIPPLEIGRTHVVPVTEERIREIAREEAERAARREVEEPRR